MQRLTACPFCGSKPELFQHPAKDGWFVKCVNANCKANPPAVYLKATEVGAIKQWNNANAVFKQQVEIRSKWEDLING